MASDAAKKKECSRYSVAFSLFNVFIFFTFVVLISSSFSFLRRFNSPTPIRIPDLDRPITSPPTAKSETRATSPGPITCDRSHFRYDLCSINGPTTLDPTTLTLHSIGPIGPVVKVRPYPRKKERSIMGLIREVSIESSPIGPKCEVRHDSPALVFSAGGYTGNFFHDIDDGILPLFVTVNYLALTDRDVILVVDDVRDWWVDKYADVLRAFSKHPIINLENDTSTHCFSRAYVGLVTHGITIIDPKAQPDPLSLAHFHSFLRNVFHQGERQDRPSPKGKPRLAWVDRAGSVGRVILNQDAARAVAEEVGFEVVFFKPSKALSLHKAFEILDASHAMIGVHGAALTHLFLLRPGAPLVQAVPLGLEWAAEVCFGRSAKEIGLEYMVYEVGVEESSLLEKYGKDDPILKDPQGLQNKGWDPKVMDVYLKEQDVRFDLVKFRGFMENVYEKAKSLMDRNG